MEQDGKLDLDSLDTITDRVLAYRPRQQAPKPKQPKRERRLARRSPRKRETENEADKPE